MKTKNLASILTIACSAVVIAATQEAPSAKQLAAFPKNIARQHYATNLFLYDATAQRYIATEAAAAWLDDDVTTGWPALAGKQHYLLQLTESQMITNFSLSAKASTTFSRFSPEKARVRYFSWSGCSTIEAMRACFM